MIFAKAKRGRVTLLVFSIVLVPACRPSVAQKSSAPGFGAPTSAQTAPPVNSVTGPSPNAQPATDAKTAPESSPLSLVVNRIGRGSNSFAPDQYVSLVATIRNNTAKTIKAAKVSYVVRDVFGDQILRLASDISKTIRPGQSFRDSGEWSIMFDDKARNAITASDADTSKLSFAIVVRLILFEDGTRYEQ